MKPFPRSMLFVFALAAGAALAGDAPELYFITPADGATVTSPVRVVFGLRGMGVAPAGVERADTGHHHLIIDAPLPPAGKPVPSDEHHRHFGGGQTEATVEFTPGRHTLQLVLGDHMHVPVEGVVSKPITIVVTTPD